MIGIGKTDTLSPSQSHILAAVKRWQRARQKFFCIHRNQEDFCETDTVSVIVWTVSVTPFSN